MDFEYFFCTLGGFMWVRPHPPSVDPNALYGDCSHPHHWSRKPAKETHSGPVEFHLRGYHTCPPLNWWDVASWPGNAIFSAADPPHPKGESLTFSNFVPG